jgi:dihydroorotate dehydrogenase
MLNAFAKLAQPLLMAMDAEKAHGVSIKALKAGFAPIGTADSPALATTVMGLAFKNPIGMAAGFDKNAEVIAPLLGAGFGFTEAGTITPLAQAGNPKPRVFRLISQRAVINRLGFNNEGLDAAKARLQALPKQSGIVGLNVGANKDTADKAEDYVKGITALYGLGDYFTINISSPNTPGLRNLQTRAALDDLLARAIEARNEEAQRHGRTMPIALKIAPDVSMEELDDITKVCLARGIDGLIVSNTTLDREQIKGEAVAAEAGGLSGAPLFEKSTMMLAQAAQRLEGKLPLIGVGGITKGAEAYEKIRAGASLVQLYTGLIYGGFGLVESLKSEMAAGLKRDGYASISEAVGSGIGDWLKRG